MVAWGCVIVGYHVKCLSQTLVGGDYGSLGF